MLLTIYVKHPSHKQSIPYTILFVKWFVFSVDMFFHFFFAFKNMLREAFKTEELTAQHAHMDLFPDTFTSIAFIIFHTHNIPIL